MTVEQEKMKTIILNFIRTHEGTSFVEIERLFERNGFDYKGNVNIIESEEYSNIIHWDGWNEAAVDILKDLVNNRIVRMVYSNIIIYLMDGKTLNLPLAKRRIKYKNPHWSPCVFSIN